LLNNVPQREEDGEMEIFEAIRSRASVRSFEKVAVPDADLERILDAGRRAPSGRNRQPIEFIVIRDPDALAKLAESQGCIAGASVAIAIAGDPERSEFWLEDVSAATTSMLLAITALGYASVWIQGTLRALEERHKETLGLPKHMRLVVVLPIGKPAGPVKQAEKRPLSDIVHWDSYGTHR
jgi:nitroreductase